MTAFQPPERQAEEIVNNAAVNELHRIADAIFALGKQAAPEPTVTYMTLSIECLSISNSLTSILDAGLSEFERAKKLRELNSRILQYSKKYRDQYEEEVRNATGEQQS